MSKEEKTLEERYAGDTLTDNSALNKYKQCVDCAFRDKTSVQGKECGWYKGNCEIFQYPDFKPNDVMLNRDVCEYRVRYKG